MLRIAAKYTLLSFLLIAFIFDNAFAEKYLFGGFGYLSNCKVYSNRSGVLEDNHRILYPYTSDVHQIIDKASGAPLIGIALRNKIRNDDELRDLLSFDLGKIGEGNQIVVTAAITYENVEYAAFAGAYQMFLSVNIDIIAFDWNTKRMLLAYPVQVRYTGRVSRKQTRTELDEWFRKIYLTNDLGINVLDQWLEALKKQDIRQKPSKFVQVASIDLSEEAAKIISSEKTNINSFKNYIANELESSLVTATHAPLIPYSMGEAISGNAHIRFADVLKVSDDGGLGLKGAIVLKTPPPDYKIIFGIRGFRQATVNDPLSEKKVYRVLGTIKLIECASGNQILNEDIYNTQYVILPKEYRMSVQDWNRYKNVLSELIETTALQFSNVNSSWLKNSAKRGKEAREEFKKAEKLFSHLHEKQNQN